MYLTFKGGENIIAEITAVSDYDPALGEDEMKEQVFMRVNSPSDGSHRLVNQI